MAPKARASTCGQGRPAPVLRAEAAISRVPPREEFAMSWRSVPQVPARARLQWLVPQRVTIVTGSSSGAPRTLLCTRCSVEAGGAVRFGRGPPPIGSARGGPRTPDDERADGQQVDRRGAEALQRIAGVVDHRAPGGVQAGVDDDRQAGAP